MTVFNSPETIDGINEFLGKKGYHIFTGESARLSKGEKRDLVVKR